MSLREFLALRVVKGTVWIIAVVSIYLLQPFRPVVFMGTSMSPTYHNFEFAVATTDTSNLKRGDVVVIDGPNGMLVKRIAYLGGEWVDDFYIGGEWSYASSVVIPKKGESLVKRGKQWVPNGHVFVLGDNSMVSVDSRQLGVFPTSAIRCVLLQPKPEASGLAMLGS